LASEIVELCDGETDGDLLVGEVGHEGDESGVVFVDRHGYLFVVLRIVVVKRG
jgi:hypothetical protein